MFDEGHLITEMQIINDVRASMFFSYWVTA